MLNVDKNPYAALEQYSKVMGILNSGRINSIVNGWCSWFYTYEHITEEEVVRNAEFVSHNLKQYGLEYIQIDEGYQRYHGEWKGNHKFPNGMKWLADKIRSFGLKPGLWIAPYIVSEPTEIFQKHPDWFLKKADGSLMRVGPWPDEETDWFKNENPKRYGLDISHPDAAKWFFNLFDTIGNKWGYEMIKIDFVAWSVFSAHHFYNLSSTPAQVYRKGLEIIRKAIGNEKHINDCGPGPVSVGLIDSMRIELDQNYGYSKAAWQQYFLDSSSSAPAAAKRFYFHKQTWINDADHICISLLSIPQAQAAATLIGMSGGNIISGDRLSDLDIPRLEILKKILPSLGEAAKPVDLFDADKQSVFALNIKKIFGEWSVVALFNSSETEKIEKEIPLDSLWMDHQKTYLAYDFWMQRFFGEISNTLKVTLLPSSVTLLALHEKMGIPQVLSTDRHILQGAHELENVKWDAEKNTLYGTSIGVLNTTHNIAIYIPIGQNWVQGQNSIYHDFENFSLKFVDDQIIRVRVRFDKKEKVDWYINFNKSFR
jgi:alpha-galactosidase